jgi:hypothetical protein
VVCAKALNNYRKSQHRRYFMSYIKFSLTETEVFRTFVTTKFNEDDDCLLGCLMTHRPDDQAVSNSELSVDLYQTTRCNTPEDSHLHTRRRENLKSHNLMILQSRFFFTSKDDTTAMLVQLVGRILGSMKLA